MSEPATLKMRSLKTPKLYMQVYQEIKDYIRKNGMKPGDKLPTEMEMCRLLGVSRNVLREAIKALEITGLVRSTPGVGSVIQEFNADCLFDSLVYNVGTDIDDMLEQFRRMRRVLELGFAQEAFNSITPENVERLGQYVQAMDSIARKNSSSGSEQATFGSRFAEADAAFHRVLYSGLKMPLLNSLLDSFWAYDKNYKSPTSHSYMLFTVEKHRKIWQALASGDYNAFRNALEVHYQVVYRKGESGSIDELLYGELNAPQPVHPATEMGPTMGTAGLPENANYPPVCDTTGKV